jgi:pimeloyl-ACP methyl ester carboxylesterase
MARRSYVDGPFGQMHLRISGPLDGSKPPLVCFHMSPMSSRTFDPFIDRIAASGRAAVAIDTPGFGMSDAPATPPSIADYATAMASAMDALGITGPVDVMGYHTGSMIACELAATRPGLVRRLVCVSTPIFSEKERAELAAHYGPEEVRADGEHVLHAWRRFHHHFSAAGASLDQIADAFPERLAARENGWWGHAAAFAFAPDMRLGEVAQPLLVLKPSDDLEEHTRRAAPLVRNGRIVDLPGWGHGFLDLHGAAAARLILSFLDAPDGDPFDALLLPSSAQGNRNPLATTVLPR